MVNNGHGLVGGSLGRCGWWWEEKQDGSVKCVRNDDSGR